MGHSVEMKGLSKLHVPKEHANFLYDNTLAYKACIHACLHWHLPLAVLNTTNTAALQLSMHRTFILLNDLIMLTGPLSQHTAITCTFEDMKHLISILLLFCQQVVIGKQR